MHRFFFLAFFLFEFILFPWSRKSVFSTLNQMVSLLPIFRIFHLFIQTHNPMKFSNVLDLKQKIFVILWKFNSLNSVNIGEKRANLISFPWFFND